MIITTNNNENFLTKYSSIGNHPGDNLFYIYFSIPFDENFPEKRIFVELQYTRKSSLKSLRKLIPLFLKKLPTKFHKVDVLPSKMYYSIRRRNSFLEIDLSYTLNNIFFRASKIYDHDYKQIFSLFIECREKDYVLDRKSAEEILKNIKNIFRKVIFPFVLSDYKTYKKRRSLWTYLKIPKQKSKNIKMRI